MAVDYQKAVEKENLLENLERVLIQAQGYGNEVVCDCVKATIQCLKTDKNASIQIINSSDEH